MKKIIIILMLLSLIPSACFADFIDSFYYPRKECPELFRWTWYNTVLETAFIAVATTDLLQTYNFLYVNPSKSNSEVNPFLSKHPSKSRFFTCATLAISGHLFIAWLLPQPGRIVWQTAPTIVELQFIKHNYNVGVRIQF